MNELVLLRAADAEALVREIRRLVGFLDRAPDVPLSDVAYTCAEMRGPSVLSLIAHDIPELRARLVSAADRLASGTAARIRDKSGTYYFRKALLGEGGGKLAFVYPGVASAYPDMLRGLVLSQPMCREAFDELEEAMTGYADFSPAAFVFPPAPCYRHDADVFKSGAYAQALVATYAACVALSRLIAAAGLAPDGVVGLAGGDLAAMMRSGAVGANFSRADRVRALRDIYALIVKAVNHGGLPQVSVLSLVLRREGEADDILASFPPDKCVLAVDFSPRQKTYVVAKDFAETAHAAFAAAGIRALPLPWDRPFNTPLCADMVPAIRKFVQTWMCRESVCDVYSSATAARLDGSLREAREDTALRWAHPVRFTETVRRMYEDGYRVFLEVGPRGMTTGAVADTLRGRDYAAIALDSFHREGVLQLQHAFGQLAALGAPLDISCLFSGRRLRRLDFDSTLSLEVRKSADMRLSRLLPRMTLLADGALLPRQGILTEPRGRGGKGAVRAAAAAQQARRQRQFDFGAMNPLVSDADTLAASPGVSVEISKVFKLSEYPFMADFAFGTSQLSYADPNLKGLVLLTVPVGLEILAEVAGLVAPNRNLLRIEDFTCRRMVSFERGELKAFVRAERIASSAPREIAVKVQLRDDSPDAVWTWPVLEATVVLTDAAPEPQPVSVEPLPRPRTVHWSSRDIYPERLCYGRRLRGIGFVEAWSESGLDYSVTVPPLAGNAVFSRFPMWTVNPVLLGIITSGFSLWRSHERNGGAFSFPFRLRRLAMTDFIPREGSTLKCYLRLTGVTPKSHLCDIVATDGNGKEILTLSGWEELAERVPGEYRAVVLQPATGFVSAPLARELLGDVATDFASAYVTDVPYALFSRNEELWLKILSRVVLSADERRDFRDMTGSVSRRTEWLFGRLAAKEAVRRFLHDYYQARWSSADIQIWADDSGKPHALGSWGDYLTSKVDIAIAHTSQFVVALAAANARVGVDVESVMRDLSEEFAQGVFTPDELELAATAAKPSQAVIKFWCAKEAVSKALGTGIRYSPKEMTVVALQADAGKLVIHLTGAWLEPFKNFKGRDIPVTVRTLRDHAVASCFIPASLFESEDETALMR